MNKRNSADFFLCNRLQTSKQWRNIEPHIVRCIQVFRNLNTLYGCIVILHSVPSLQRILKNWNALLDWSAISFCRTSTPRSVGLYWAHRHCPHCDCILQNCNVLCWIVVHSARRILQHCQQVKLDHRCSAMHCINVELLISPLSLHTCWLLSWQQAVHC